MVSLRTTLNEKYQI